MANTFVLRATGKVLSKMFELHKRISFENSVQDDLEISEKMIGVYLRYHHFFHVDSKSHIRNLIYYFYIHVDPDVLKDLKILQAIASVCQLTRRNCMALPSFAEALTSYRDNMKKVCSLLHSVSLEEIFATLSTPEIQQLLDSLEQEIERKQVSSCWLSFLVATKITRIY